MYLAHSHTPVTVTSSQPAKGGEGERERETESGRERGRERGVYHDLRARKLSAVITLIIALSYKQDITVIESRMGTGIYQYFTSIHISLSTNHITV